MLVVVVLVQKVITVSTLNFTRIRTSTQSSVRFHVDYRIKGHTPLGVSFTLPLPPTLLNLVPVLREITPGSMLNLLISTELHRLIPIIVNVPLL